MCLKHGYIPNRNINDANNFRPIAIATILFELFEHIIIDICPKVFKTSDNQFGFKAKVSSDMFVFTLKQLILTYRKQGSTVYCAFLDDSKAFNRVNHCMLFKKVIEKNMPTCFVRILYYWYSKQNMKVKWGNCLSSPFSESNGIRQGGVLSPYLFAFYIDDLSVKLNCVKAGCFLDNSRLNHIIYADDLCCFSPSLDGLQDLVNVCSNYAVEHDITFNCSKSVGELFFPKYLFLSIVPKVFLCDNVVKFKNNLKYLGVFLNNNLKDDDEIYRQVCYLYEKSYQLKATFSKCSHTIKNILFNYHCTSFYASHLWSKYLCSSLNYLRVAYNNSFRLIHGLKRNVSARELQVKANISTFDALQRKLINRFIERCCLSINVYVNTRMYGV